MSALERWHQACDRLRSLGDQLVAEPFDDDPGEVLHGFEHLVDQVSLFTAWEVLHADPSRPFFHRHNDLVSQWGGPNADNVYRHARIDPAHRYVIRGRMHSCEEFILAIRAGFMHQPVWGTLQQVTATELGIETGQDFELTIGGPGADIDLPEGAVMASVREYYFDWRPLEPATITIECLDPSDTAPLTEEALGRRLDDALSQMEHSIGSWRDYMATNRAERVDNSYAADALAVAKGLSAARYEFCFWDLGPDDALVITWDEPPARYWAAQLYMMQTFELVDPYGAISSRNQLQTSVDPDGRVRYVVSAADPGVPNWLDTTGRRHGLCTLRWFWPTGDPGPSPETAVVPVGEVRSILPAQTPVVAADDRARELAGRQAHLRWRFRS